jgi:hypothetical protein
MKRLILLVLLFCSFSATAGDLLAGQQAQQQRWQEDHSIFETGSFMWKAENPKQRNNVGQGDSIFEPGSFMWKAERDAQALHGSGATSHRLPGSSHCIPNYSTGGCL